MGVEERLLGRPVGQGLVGPLGVVGADVAGHSGPGFLNVLEGVEPSTFLFESAEEPLAKAVQLGSVGRDIFLAAGPVNFFR